MTSRQPSSRAFVAVEAIAIAIITLVLIGIILVSIGDTRRQGRLNRDLANLRQIGAWTFAYANDFEDLYPTFSAVPNSIFPDLRATASSPSMLVQATGHATDIIRRRTGRNSFPVPLSWLPHIRFSHLVLSDYAQRQLPDATFVSTGDKHRLNWLDDPINKHDKGFWQPFQNPESGTPEPSAWKWPYSASFQTPPAWFDTSLAGSRLSQTSHTGYSVPTEAILGGPPLADVNFPAQKVMVHDYGAWHFTRQSQYFLHNMARVPVLMGDGNASPRPTAASNVGWMPNRPTQLMNRAIISYFPRSWEPPLTDHLRDSRVFGRYRWTRGGIQGRDFDGPEIDTGQY